MIVVILHWTMLKSKFIHRYLSFFQVDLPHHECKKFTCIAYILYCNGLLLTSLNYHHEDYNQNVLVGNITEYYLRIRF